MQHFCPSQALKNCRCSVLAISEVSLLHRGLPSARGIRVHVRPLCVWPAGGLGTGPAVQKLPRQSRLAQYQTGATATTPARSNTSPLRFATQAAPLQQQKQQHAVQSPLLSQCDQFGQLGGQQQPLQAAAPDNSPGVDGNATPGQLRMVASLAPIQLEGGPSVALLPDAAAQLEAAHIAVRSLPRHLNSLQCACSADCACLVGTVPAGAFTQSVHEPTANDYQLLYSMDRSSIQAQEGAACFGPVPHVGRSVQVRSGRMTATDAAWHLLRCLKSRQQGGGGGGGGAIQDLRTSLIRAS